MKLRKQFAYSYKDRDYHKFTVNLPAELVGSQGWTGGEELEALPRKEGVLIREAKRKRPPPPLKRPGRARG